MGFVPVLLLRHCFTGVTGLRVDHRDGSIRGHFAGDQPFAFPIGVGFYVLADHHRQQTHRVGLFTTKNHTLHSFQLRFPRFGGLFWLVFMPAVD